VNDYETTYRDLRLRVIDLVGDQPSEVVEQLAPGTPEWRVRDVVAHLGGVCDDIAHGSLEGVASDAWTDAQVAKRRDWPFARVLDDWIEHAQVVEPMMNAIGHPMGQMLFDAWTHEQDVRGALGVPGARSGTAVELALQWLVDTNGAGLPAGVLAPAPLRVIADGEELVLGSGEPGTTVRTSKFEFLRALAGRRSLDQVRALDAAGAPLESVLFFGGFFTPASRDIVE
jgi:uncharacterized protein (TIGR03083 family)